MGQVLSFVPWLLTDIGIIYTTLVFGPQQFSSSPLIAKNLGLILTAFISMMTIVLLAFIKKVGVKSAVYWSGYLLEVSLGCWSVAHLISRDNTRGHSMMIWYVLVFSEDNSRGF